VVQEEEDIASVTIDEQLKRLGLTEPQKQRMHEWMHEKEGIKLVLFSFCCLFLRFRS